MKKENKIKKEAIRGLVGLIVILGLLIFLSADKINYWQGWLYLAAFTASVVFITLYLWKHDRKLLERRIKAGAGAEKVNVQKIIQSLTSVIFILLYVVSGFDQRRNGSGVPGWLSIVSDVFVLLGFAIVWLVFKENSYTSGVIEVSKEQKVIESGPYKAVRHPMYAGALLMILATPMALGSYWGIIPALLMIIGIGVRLIDEEKYLSVNLAGYKKYLSKIKYRLIPGIW